MSTSLLIWAYPGTNPHIPSPHSPLFFRAKGWTHPLCLIPSLIGLLLTYSLREGAPLHLAVSQAVLSLNGFRKQDHWLPTSVHGSTEKQKTCTSLVSHYDTSNFDYGDIFYHKNNLKHINRHYTGMAHELDSGTCWKWHKNKLWQMKRKHFPMNV